MIRKKCCLCNEPLEDEFGNNPAPVKQEGRCCDVCNATKVIPARLKEVRLHGDWKG